MAGHTLDLPTFEDWLWYKGCKTRGPEDTLKINDYMD